MHIVLQVIGGPGLGRSGAATRGRPLHVGRSVLAHLRVADDDRMAGVHFEIECGEGTCRLRDVSGSLGLKVNGQAVRAVDLKVGDVIVAGNSTFEVRAPGAATATATLTPSAPATGTLTPTASASATLTPAPPPAATLAPSLQPPPRTTLPVVQPPPPAPAAPPAPPQPAGPTAVKVGDVLAAEGGKFQVRTAALAVPAPPEPPEPPKFPLPPQLARPLADVLRGQGEPLFAVLDAARDPQVYLAMLNCKEKHQSLFEGQKAEQMAFVAPYLVQVQPDGPFLESLLKAGWGKSWGVYLTSRAPFEAVRAHLRHFMVVTLVGGKQVYFRYYDPRVLRAFLPSCTDEEWATFFGPVSAYLIEGDDPALLLQMTVRGAPAKTATIAVQPPA